MTVPATAPPQPEVVASGMYRLGAMASPVRDLKLTPISEDFRKPVVPNRADEDDDEYGDPGSYQLAPVSTVRVGVARRQVPAVQRIYRKQMHSGLGILRKLSDLAYLLSWPFILLILFGAATDHRNLAVLGALGVILLSLGRLAIDGFFLVAVHFRNSPIEGVLFFIPPLTFYYLFKRWSVIGPAAARLLTPIVLIVGVVLAFVFIPSLSSGSVAATTNIGDRIKEEAGILREDIKGELDRGVDALDKATEGMTSPTQDQNAGADNATDNQGE